jgi:thioredoxin
MSALPAMTKTAFETESGIDDAPIILDFWASWCGSCRLLAPTVEKIADDLAGRVRVATVDIEDQPELAEILGVMSLPTLVLYRGGGEVTRVSGVKGRQALLDAFVPHL